MVPRVHFFYVFVGSQKKLPGRKCVFRIGHVFVHVSWADEGSGRETTIQGTQLKMNMTSKSKKVAEQNILNNGKCNVKHFELWGGGQRRWWV